MKKDKSTIVEQDGVVYSCTKAVAFPLFCRVLGVLLIVSGATSLLVSPVVGAAVIALGLLLIFKIAKSKSQKKQVIAIKSPCLAGCSTFGNWHEKVHRGAAQSDRFERAAHECIALGGYDPKTGVATINGSSGKDYTTTLDYCSCEDFQKRSKPCKHIYFLAMQMGFTSEDFYN